MIADDEQKSTHSTHALGAMTLGGFPQSPAKARDFWEAQLSADAPQRVAWSLRGSQRPRVAGSPGRSLAAPVAAGG